MNADDHETVATLCDAIKQYVSTLDTVDTFSNLVLRRSTIDSNPCFLRAAWQGCESCLAGLLVEGVCSAQAVAGSDSPPSARDADESRVSSALVMISNDRECVMVLGIHARNAMPRSSTSESESNRRNVGIPT